MTRNYCCIKKHIKHQRKICIIACDICFYEKFCCIKMLFGYGKLTCSKYKKKNIFCVSMSWNAIKHTIDFGKKNLTETKLEVKVL